jgi:hypothetical protein
LELCSGTDEVMAVLNGDDSHYYGPTTTIDSSLSIPSELDTATETSDGPRKETKGPPSLARVKQALSYDQKRVSFSVGDSE